MKVAFFNTKPYDRRSFEANTPPGQHELFFFEPHLNLHTAALAQGFTAICVFVNDTLDRRVIERLADLGVRLVLLRCAGFNNVDVAAAQAAGITVARVPDYSPYAVAEHALALIMTLNRKTHRAYNRVREGNFSLDGLLGEDIHGQTVGVVGTGKIGAVFARIMKGLGCTVLAYDVQPNPDCEALGVVYVSLDTLLAESDIISLHCPLTATTRHLVNPQTVGSMKDGVTLINTSRGGLIDTQAVIDGLKSGKIAYVGLDVYEEESDLFFEDLSGDIIQDDVFTRLLMFPNVLVTGHQAFFTENALTRIAQVTLDTLTRFEQGLPLHTQVGK